MVVVCFELDFAQLVVGTDFDDLSNVYFALMVSTTATSKFDSILAADFVAKQGK